MWRLRTDRGVWAVKRSFAEFAAADAQRACPPAAGPVRRPARGPARLVLFDFARTSPDRMAALYGAYRDAGGPGRVETPADFSLLIAQLGHIGAMQLRRWLDPATSATERAHAQRGLDEFLDDPLRRSTIDAILAVVT